MRRQKSAALPQNDILSGSENTNGGLTTEVREKLRRLELISEMVEICNATTNLNELMEKVFKTVVRDVGAEAGSLWLAEEDGEENVCYVAEGPTRDKVLNMRLPKGVGVVGFVIDSGECQTIFDTSRDERFTGSVDQKTGFRTRSMICAPLIVENRAIGALQLLNKRTDSGQFNPEDLSLLKLLCQGSATPIVNARLRASEKKVQELSIMLEISKEITSTLDLEGCMLSVVNLCSKLIAYDRAAIGLVEKDSVRIAAISGQPSVRHNDPDVERLQRLLQGVNKKGEDLYLGSGKRYLKNEEPDPHVKEYLHRYHMGSLAVYRLYDEESELGVFMMESKKESLLSGSQIERIGILKNMLTVALRNAQLYNSVPKLSVWDSWKKAREVPLKKYLIVGSVFTAVVLALAFIKPAYNIGGKVEVRPLRKYELYTRVDGQVIRVFSGAAGEVHKGDTLLWFDTAELEQDLEKQHNRLRMLKQTMASLKQQSKHSEYHQKSLEAQQTQLAIEALERKIRDSRVVAPVAGRLVNDDIRHYAGRRFSRGDAVTEIVSNREKAVDFYVAENEIHRIRAGQSVRFRVPAYPGESFTGTVLQVAFETRKEGGVTWYPVLVELDAGRESLIPGMTGRGKVAVAPMSLLERLGRKGWDYLTFKFWL